MKTRLLLDFPEGRGYTLFMSLFELLLVAVGLSMDAFAVSICKGLTLQEKTWKKTWLPTRPAWYESWLRRTGCR